MSQIICDCLKSFTAWIEILEGYLLSKTPQESMAPKKRRKLLLLIGAGCMKIVLLMLKDVM